MKHVAQRLLALALVGTAIALAIVAPGTLVHADSTPAGTGLQISPAIVQLNADPGKTYTVNIKVTNVTSSTLSFVSNVDDFGAKDETGAPNILISGTKTVTSIQDWVGTLPDFTLDSKAQEPITVSISVPANAEPGGHYGVIRFTGEPTDNRSTSLGLNASAGTLILLRVNGQATEKLNLITFEATKSSIPNSFFESGPLSFETRFQNKGNVHVEPVGQIEIKDMFGNKVNDLAVNSEKGNVLPDSIRRFDIPFNKTWLFGKYTADISVAYGTTGGAIVESLSFWVIPWKILLIVLVILATIFYILRTLIKRYNKYIIDKANKQNDKNDKKPKAKKH